MPKNISNIPYNLLARYYDEVMVDHAELFRAVREKLLRKILPQVRSVCDLACGSGETALDFAGRGLTVYAVDLAPGQVRHVREKAADLCLPVKALRADMRSFRLPRRRRGLPKQVDLVTCEFDALNHVPRHSDLARVLGSVARALKPGGWFYFDVNTQRAFEEIWTTQNWIDTPDFKLVLHGGFDPAKMRAWLDLEWFLPEGKLWRHKNERVDEVCWTPGEIRAALREAGFQLLREVDGAPFFRGWDWATPGCRTFYLARKKSK